MPAVWLADLLVMRCGRGDLAEAESLLRLVESEPKPLGLFWKSEFFRYFVVRARLARAEGGDVAPWASKALEIAADTRPQAKDHPTIGVVRTDEATLVELRLLVGKQAERWA